jgi:hypothetical protein
MSGGKGKPESGNETGLARVRWGSFRFGAEWGRGVRVGSGSAATGASFAPGSTAVFAGAL